MRRTPGETPCSRYPVRHPPETGQRRMTHTNSREGRRVPGLRSSGRVCSGVPGIERDGHTDTATGAARPPGPSAVRLRRRPPLGAERLAGPTPRHPDRTDPTYGVVQKQGRGIGLLSAPLPTRSHTFLFFTHLPAIPLLTIP